ncbi:hypothetical protein HDC92_004309 [Pedobacter sp. AK017]|uniref:hypothetical protein n=1 Tax=Pedobacter sp. AK017 TaxID=2723073 RepID=UPI001613D46A|nr:hypothetical protein [Pedobacter sp. AK017]MBB5440606.1 hypothetical protein [Pedobacter sp. AK017]
MVVVISLDFKTVYKAEVPEDYFDLISKYPKNQLLQRLSFLSGKADEYLHALLDSNEEATHLKYLEMFVLSPKFLAGVIDALKPPQGALVVAYSRETILYAMEEILLSNLPDGAVDEVVYEQFTIDVFNYLLCLNGLYFKAENLKDDSTLEEFNASLLPANNIPDYNAFTCCIKGVRLIRFLMEDPTYLELVKGYFKREYSCSVEQYLGFYLRWGLIESSAVSIDAEDPEYPIFKKLAASSNSGRDVQKLTSVRISPVYQVSANEFVILDKAFFVGKIYYQFVYEFWFSCVKKAKPKIAAEVYFSKIGRFFEQYCAELFNMVFSFLRHPAPLSLDQLVYISGDGEKEMIDYYARENRKLVIAEFKQGNLNDEDRYSGTIEGLYSNGEDTFFKNLTQLDNVISQLDLLQEKFDRKLEKGRRLTIYPVCVLNDPIYEFPTMKIAFAKKWELLRIKHTHLDVRPLAIFQVEELENLVYRLVPNRRGKEIWQVLKVYCRIDGQHRAFNLSALDECKLDYHTGMDEELQGYMDSYVSN